MKKDTCDTDIECAIRTESCNKTDLQEIIACNEVYLYT